MRILLDTNISLRNANQNDPAYPSVNAALTHLLAGGWEPCVSLQNLAEFWVVATRPVNVNGLGLSPGRAYQEISDILRTFTFLRDPPDLPERWLELCLRYSVSGRQAHDARLVALMLGHGITHILTLNGADFARYTEITVLAPDNV